MLTQDQQDKLQNGLHKILGDMLDASPGATEDVLASLQTLLDTLLDKENSLLEQRLNELEQQQISLNSLYTTLYQQVLLLLEQPQEWQQGKSSDAVETFIHDIQAAIIATLMMTIEDKKVEIISAKISNENQVRQQEKSDLLQRMAQRKPTAPQVSLFKSSSNAAVPPMVRWVSTLLPLQTDPLKKIVLLGDAGVGKSALMQRFIDGRFQADYVVTLGAVFKHVSVAMKDQKSIKLEIWDVTGSERYRRLGGE